MAATATMMQQQQQQIRLGGRQTQRVGGSVAQGPGG